MDEASLAGPDASAVEGDSGGEGGKNWPEVMAVNESQMTKAMEEIKGWRTDVGMMGN